MPLPAPHISSLIEVRPDWVDYNGHINMAYYAVIMDQGGDEIYPHIGLGETYAKTARHTTYTAEVHICYKRELKLGDRVRVHTRLLDFDAKRMVLFHEIHHENGWIAATAEELLLHIDMSGPCVVPFPPEISVKLSALKDSHSHLPSPAQAGRSISLKNKAA
ncbi:thioesterase family protein [Celeribacter halophilus]|uniref:(3S)-malyl-CoA thioesterase n=1 Tax=Celeribacter halophilus TaxID=576117 RepID=A0A1I3W0M5_9RHOB|nr:thioesterase family protein [Celeribacter halophilus]PZX06836.1 acyl-CoA thioester hydrolase [Celeribacter halophilus]SFK00909.1 (3S)-malyl-CoA thioesterase [Celeribacter halophilus]